jgi:hypothetical protein
MPETLLDVDASACPRLRNREKVYRISPGSKLRGKLMAPRTTG